MINQAVIISTTKDGRGRHNFKDLTGQRFGRLIPLYLAEHRRAKCGRSCIYWVCRCDCGREKEISSKILLSGRTLSCGCLCREVASTRARAAIGEKNSCWRGGRRYNKAGYVVLSGQNYPGKKRSSEKEHTIIMTRLLGRPLEKGESVHHKNGIRDDNSPENLELWTTQQPPGKRIEDLIIWAKALLTQYCPEVLK